MFFEIENVVRDEERSLVGHSRSVVHHHRRLPSWICFGARFFLVPILADSEMTLANFEVLANYKNFKLVKIAWEQASFLCRPGSH